MSKQLHTAQTGSSQDAVKTWKPTAAGILIIVAGTFTAYYRTFGSFANHWHYYQAFTAVLGLIAIVGGIFAIKRQRWVLALIGAICAIYPPHPWQDFSWTPIVGVAAVILLVLSKDEFPNTSDKTSNK